MPVIQNEVNNCVVKCIQTETISLANTQLGSSIESTVVGLSIKRVLWSGQVTIARGSNSCLTFPAGTAGEWYMEGIELNQDSTANVVITITGTGTSILELEKLYV